MLPRPITDIELNWVNQILEQEQTISEEIKSFYKAQASSLSIVKEWDCCEPKCGSIDFTKTYKHSYGFADGAVKYKGHAVMATLFHDPDNKILTQLEILTNPDDYLSKQPDC